MIDSNKTINRKDRKTLTSTSINLITWALVLHISIYIYILTPISIDFFFGALVGNVVMCFKIFMRYSFP